MRWFHKIEHMKRFAGQTNTDTAVKFVEVKIKEFAEMYSYDCTYNYEDLRFFLKPNNRFSLARNSFRPEINVFINQDMDNEITVSLCQPAKVVISIIYTLLFAFGLILSYFSLIGSLDMTGIAVWGVLFVFSTIFVCIGRLITFRYTFLKLQTFFCERTPLKGL